LQLGELIHVIAQDRTIRRWEQSEQAISGPAWVAIEMILRSQGEIALADRVTGVIEQRRRKREIRPLGRSRRWTSSRA
jgi:hypothetical protein